MKVKSWRSFPMSESEMSQSIASTFLCHLCKCEGGEWNCGVRELSLSFWQPLLQLQQPRGSNEMVVSSSSPPLPAPPFSFFSSSHGCANLGRAVAADRDANDIIEDGCTESCLPSCFSIQTLLPSKSAKFDYIAWGEIIISTPIIEQREIAQLWWKEEAGIDKT